MALLTVQNATNGIASVSFGAANSGGDTVPAGTRGAGWDLSVLLLVRNADAANKTVTVDGTPYVVTSGGGIAVVPVYAGTYGMVKSITYSAVTSVTVAAVRVAPAP